MITYKQASIFSSSKTIRSGFRVNPSRDRKAFQVCRLNNPEPNPLRFDVSTHFRTRGFCFTCEYCLCSTTQLGTLIYGGSEVFGRDFDIRIDFFSYQNPHSRHPSLIRCCHKAATDRFTASPDEYRIEFMNGKKNPLSHARRVEGKVFRCFLP